MSPKDKQLVREALETVGIAGLRHKLLTELSGGERQKAYLAMMLAQDTDVLLLDEPTTYMDIQYESAFFRLLERLKTEKGITLLVILHNLSQAVRYADRIVVLDGGRVCYQGDAQSGADSGVLESVLHVKRNSVVENGRRLDFYTARE